MHVQYFIHMNLFADLLPNIYKRKNILRMGNSGFEDIQHTVASLIPDFKGKLFPIQNDNIL